MVVLASVLAGCTAAGPQGGGGDADAGGAEGEDGGAPASDFPEVSEGQVAVDIHDSEGESFEIRCPFESGSFSVMLQPVPDSAGGGEQLSASCAYLDGARYRAFQLVMRRDSLAPGSYAIGPGEGDQLSFVAHDDGEGLSLPASQGSGVTFSGTLTVEENAGSGGTMKATWSATYPKVSRVTGGVADELLDRPGEMVGAMHVVLP